MSGPPETASRHRPSGSVFATDVFETGDSLADDDPNADSQIAVRAIDAPRRARVGEPVGVVVTVENAGEDSDSLSDELVVDGGETPRRSFTADAVAAGGTRDVVLAASFDETGVHTLSLCDADVETTIRVGVH